jgi:hypothetical protein
MLVSHHNSFADKHHFSLSDEVKRGAYCDLEYRGSVLNRFQLYGSEKRTILGGFEEAQTGVPSGPFWALLTGVVLVMGAVLKSRNMLSFRTLKKPVVALGILEPGLEPHGLFLDLRPHTTLPLA